MLKIRSIIRFFLVLSILAATFSLQSPQTTLLQAQGTCIFNGEVYQDYNASGDRQTGEPGVAAILVSAYDADNAVVAQATSDANGAYSLTGLDDNTEYRLELSNLPDYLESGPFGPDSPTTVTFATCTPAAPGVAFGVNNAGQYCSDNPELATSCYVVGNQLVDANGDPRTEEETLISFPYNSGGPPGSYDGPHGALASASQVGTTWGLAYHRTTGTLLAGAFMKRHTGFGPGGPGAIYAVDMDGSGTVSTLTTLAAGANPHPDNAGGSGTQRDWLLDSDSWAEAGKMALGDMDISDDDRTLWAVNLFDRRLYEIPLTTVSRDQPPQAGNPRTYALTGLPNNCPAGDVRPFATSFHQGRVYVGMVCSSESTPAARNLWAYVYSLEPGTNNFRQELQISLDYPRRCANNASTDACLGVSPAAWNSWTDDFDLTQIGGPPAEPPANPVRRTIVYPQPILSDIEFDNSGMILGFRDRFGDQAGNLSFSPFDGTDSLLYLGVTAGDMLRVCRNGGGAWELENNGSCGGVTTAGAGNTEGPGGGEFYFAENLEDYHDELFIGGLTYVPGQPDITGTYFDPIPDNSQLNDAGIRWLNNSTGGFSRAYRVYNGDQGFNDVRPFFGKANGLGDLEAICAPAPIEIGNRVWFDANSNGIQDPGPAEFPVEGVTVNLYLASDPTTPIASVLTDSEGGYYFSDANVPLTGMLPFTDYVIRLDNPADYEAGGPLFEWFLTRSNVGGGGNGDLRDSDGVMSRFGGGELFPTIAVSTGPWGQNNHTLDFGFSDIEPPDVDDETSTPQSPPPGTPGTPVANVGVEFSMSKSVNQPFAQIGDIVTWTITIRNPNTSTARNVRVTDTMPGGLTIVSASASSGNVSYSGSTVTYTNSSVGPGQSVSVNIATRIDGGGFILENSAFCECGDENLNASARVVRASLQPATGITNPIGLILVGLALLIGLGGIFLALRRRQSI